MNKISLAFPLRTRRQIPFYHNKSEAEFRQDPYESYHHKVMRQSRLHLADDCWDSYPYQAVLDWMRQHFPRNRSVQNIADIGCGVGRLVGELAQQYPQINCWGIDYSYQLLRQAHDYWIAGKTLDIIGHHQGWADTQVTGKCLKNIHLGLAKGEALPFENHSLEVVVSSFTLDRFEQPILALQEIYRVLTDQGTALIVSPLNFQQARHWEQFFPLPKLLQQLEQIGFSIEKVEEDLVVQEPIDRRGNVITWHCLGLVLCKNS